MTCPTAVITVVVDEALIARAGAGSGSWGEAIAALPVRVVVTVPALRPLLPLVPRVIRCDGFAWVGTDSPPVNRCDGFTRIGTDLARVNRCDVLTADTP